MDAAPAMATELDRVVDAIRSHPGLWNKSAIGLVTEVLGPSDWLTGPGDDAAAVDAPGFPGGKVVGIRLSDPVEVHIVADEVPLPPVAVRVGAAAHAVLAGAGEDRAVQVIIDDVVAAALERRHRS